MRQLLLVPLALALPACGGDDNGGGSPDASHDVVSTDVTLDTASDVATDVTAQDVATDTGTDTGLTDAGDGGCPASWLLAPTVDPTIAVPSDGGMVLVHSAAAGWQNYACTAAADGGASGWTFVGPTADLSDCHGTLVAHHFATDGGAAFPEWQALDGTYVVGHKVAAFTPDGGASSVPWLLLQGVGHGGTGPLGQVTYVQRVDTDGGVAPSATCDAGATAQVPYAADYYFFGP
ncbi:MAG TPA: DUF3455 domain-containing protein [Polyangiaceae bacterium]|jgi:hypothetical protein